MNSCFLFKPVQKTCPAYSLNKQHAKTGDYVYAKQSLLNDKSFK